MSLSFNFSENEVPPGGGWRYQQHETGHWIHSPSWEELIKDVAKYRKLNNFPIGAQFEQEIREQLCSFLPPEFCKHTDPSAKHFQVSPLTLHEAKETASMLVTWFTKYRRRKVEPSQATARAAKCVRCPFNQKITGCANCSLNVIRELINQIVGGARTEHDNRLESCLICRCTLKAKIWLPIELLKEFLTEEKLNTFPSAEVCWIRQEAS